MINPSINDLMKNLGSKYLLCNIVAKRARQLLENSTQLAKGKDEKPITIAANELRDGKLSYTRIKPKSKLANKTVFHTTLW